MVQPTWFFKKQTGHELYQPLLNAKRVPLKIAFPLLCVLFNLSCAVVFENWGLSWPWGCFAVMWQGNCPRFIPDK